MTDINCVILNGRLTRNGEIKYLQNGTAVMEISMAVNRNIPKGDQRVDEVSYFDVTLFGKMAEGVKPYMMKGKQLSVEGFLKQDRWNKDGKNFSKVRIVANAVQLLGGRDSSPRQNAGGYPYPQGQQGYGQQNMAPYPQGQQSDSGFEYSVQDSEFPEDVLF